jgi:small Trp-rich protein
MPLIIITVLTTILKFFEVWRFGELSWWWITLLFAITFIWFEFLETLFGRDKNTKSHDVQDKIRRDRIKKQFQQDNKRR